MAEDTTAENDNQIQPVGPTGTVLVTALKPTILVTVPVTEQAGDKIGRYKLLQQIGEGGCGVVYMAEQEEPVRRRVALKVIKLGMDTKSVIARFEAARADFRCHSKTAGVEAQKIDRHEARHARYG